MKIKTLFATAMLSVVALFAASCSSSNNDIDPDSEITTQTIQGCLNICYSASSSTTTVLEDVNFTVTINYGKKTATVTLTGLSLPGGVNYPSLTVKDAPCKISNGEKIVDLTNVQPTSPGYVAPVFDKFHMYILDRAFYDEDGKQQYVPVFYVQATIGDNTMLITPNIVFEFGTTESVAADEKPFTTDDAEYQIILSKNTSDELVADIHIYGARFHSGMPPFQNMVFGPIPVTFDPAQNGTMTLKKSLLTPSISGTPYPQFPISNLSSTLSLEKGMHLDFVCSVKGVDYTVTATLANLK